MRITDSMSNRMLTNYLLRNRDDLYKLQEQTSSGVKVDRPSDDPGSFDLITRANNENSRLEQFLSNSTRLEGDLLITDSNLQNAHDSILRASELVVAGSDGTKNPEDLKALAKEINQIIESLVGVANTSISGSYAFAGLRQNVPAYDVQRDAAGQITAVTYQGSPETRQIEIAEAEYLPANLVGSDLNGQNGVFQTASNDLFADLVHIRDRLAAGQNLAEADICIPDSATSTLTVNSLYATGTTVTLSSSSGILPTGLSSTATYYAIRVSDTEIQLADSLQNARAGIAVNFTDNGSGDLSVTQTHLADIERNEDQLMEALTRLGSYEERLALNEKMISAKQMDLSEKLENEQSVDIAEAVMELSNKQAAYEASMKITMSTLQTTLLNYL